MTEDPRSWHFDNLPADVVAVHQLYQRRSAPRPVHLDIENHFQRHIAKCPGCGAFVLAVRTTALCGRCREDRSNARNVVYRSRKRAAGITT